MNWTITELAQAVPVPWKNGGGVTRELLTYPSSEQWSVRLSVAHIAQDGPFSVFDGVLRWFAVLSGAGVQLEIQSKQAAKQVANLYSDSAPIAFNGSDATYCSLIDGPTTDFNLMTTLSNARLERVGPTLTFECSTLFKAGGSQRLLGVFSQEGGQPSQLVWTVTQDANVLDLNALGTHYPSIHLGNALVLEVLL
jgi:environmental stress-induced protein Ves